jgi:hypothetical protein
MFASAPVSDMDIFVQGFVGAILIGGPLLLSVAALAGYFSWSARPAK